MLAAIAVISDDCLVGENMHECATELSKLSTAREQLMRIQLVAVLCTSANTASNSSVFAFGLVLRARYCKSGDHAMQ